MRYFERPNPVSMKMDVMSSAALAAQRRIARPAVSARGSRCFSCISDTYCVATACGNVCQAGRTISLCGLRPYSTSE